MVRHIFIYIAVALEGLVLVAQSEELVPSTTDVPWPTATGEPVPAETEVPLPTVIGEPIPAETELPIPTITGEPVPAETEVPMSTVTGEPVPAETEVPMPTVTGNPVPAETEAPIPESLSHKSEKPFYYHKHVGIPLAKRVYDMEMKIKDNGENTKDNVGIRIVKGINSTLGQHTYFAGIVIHLKNGFISMCGCSLLSHQKSITAAHCWYDGKETPALFELVHQSNTIYFGGLRTNTSDVVIHENYSRPYLYNDIAMITHKFIPYNKYISPISLPSATDNFIGKNATAVGFGRTHHINDTRGDFTYYQPKRQVDITIISDRECQRYIAITKDQNICTRGTYRATGTCQGDSGGPLTVVINRIRKLVGLTSYGAELCDKYPYVNVFTEVTYYLDWIKTKL